MQNSVSTSEITFRCDGKQRKLIVTTQAQQYSLDAGQSLELADMLYHVKDELFRTANGLPEPTLPEWVSEL